MWRHANKAAALHESHTFHAPARMANATPQLRVFSGPGLRRPLTERDVSEPCPYVRRTVPDDYLPQFFCLLRSELVNGGVPATRRPREPRQGRRGIFD